MTLLAITLYNDFVIADSSNDVTDYNGIEFYFKKHHFSVIHDYTTNTHVVFKVTRSDKNNNAIIYYAHITIDNVAAMTLHDLYYYIISDYIR